MALAAAKSSPTPKGSTLPRLAPPTPARSDWRAFHAQAAELGISLYPWQDTTSRFLEAKDPKGRWLYPEVAIIVGRQSGKTTLLEPLIVRRLRAGRRIMHTAQNRELPREVHDRVATVLLEHYRDELPPRRGIRYGAGQEEIRLRNGGRYRIVAPTRGGARGPANDDVIIDELREMEDHDFIAAAEPTLSAASNPQMIYLSNAGTEDSEVLNAIRQRAGKDPALAYLEWSAAPEREANDEEGWLQANPDIGHNPSKLAYLRRKFESYRLAGQLAIFETEHLCRWVTTTAPGIVTPHAWAVTAGPVEEPRSCVLGISMDPTGERASAVIAWRQSDQRIAVRTVADVTGHPIDIERLGPDLRELARTLRVTQTATDAWSDALTRYLPRPKRETGRDFASASGEFVRLVNIGQLRHALDDVIGADLDWTSRRPYGSDGGWMAAMTNEDRPVTAILAAIRAIWLVSTPRTARAQIY